MKWHGVDVYTSSDFKFTRPRLYTNGAWKDATCYVYTNGAWKMVGGACTHMIPFIDSNGSPVYVDGNQMMVREIIGAQKLQDKNSNNLIDKNNVQLYVEWRGTD